MGQKDISEKVLVDYNDVFADILNVCIYNGKEIVKPEELTNTAVHSQYKAEDGKLHEQERDVTKFWKEKNTAIAIFGIENQIKVDKKMPFRIIGYDGATYRGQLLDKAKKVVPVVSFVLYFGTEERWNKHLSIKECLDIPKDLEEYVNEYRIHVIEVAWLTDEQLKQFKSDFGIVANFFVQKRKNKHYRPDDPREIKHVDEVLKLLSVMTGDKEYESILYYNQESGEVKNMCSVAQRLIREGREEGIQQGIQQGIQVLVGVLRKVGIPEEEILEVVMEEYKLEKAKVLQYLE
ncbi:MAG: Rpn family recombination-promoting nuclease/putative transposase [Agathobacter sp.]|nr:Rpn family recombination-promoting nuclease/putative transposase [Agathobacter sp.]